MMSLFQPLDEGLIILLLCAVGSELQSECGFAEPRPPLFELIIPAHGSSLPWTEYAYAGALMLISDLICLSAKWGQRRLQRSLVWNHTDDHSSRLSRRSHQNGQIKVWRKDPRLWLQFRFRRDLKAETRIHRNYVLKKKIITFIPFFLVCFRS